MQEAVKPNAAVSVGSVSFANDRPIALFAGPCQMESRAHALEMASALKEIASRLGIGLVYKTSFDKANRTACGAKRGLGLDGALAVFAEIRASLDVPVVTDVHDASQCAEVAQVVDVLQIPAFLCRQTDLLVAAAQTGRTIKVKKGQFLAPWDMRNVVAKVTGSGNANVLVTERGASFGYNRLVVDMRALPILRGSAARSSSMPRMPCSSRVGRGRPRAGNAVSCRPWRGRRWPSASPDCSSKPTRIRIGRPPTGPTWFPSKPLRGCCAI